MTTSLIKATSVTVQGDRTFHVTFSDPAKTNKRFFAHFYPGLRHLSLDQLKEAKVSKDGTKLEFAAGQILDVKALFDAK